MDIVKKQYGVVSLRFADVSVAQGTDASFNVTDYNTKNFVFFNVIDGQVKDRELQDWDLWAVKYHDFYSAMGQSGTMVVTGILTNPKEQESFEQFITFIFNEKKIQYGMTIYDNDADKVSLLNSFYPKNDFILSYQSRKEKEALEEVIKSNAELTKNNIKRL